jgi:hypothetical protein
LIDFSDKDAKIMQWGQYRSTNGTAWLEKDTREIMKLYPSLTPSTKIVQRPA